MKLELLNAFLYANTSLRIMRSIIEEEGLEWLPLIKEANISADLLDNLDGEVSGIQELRLQQAFANATRHISGVWLRTGLRYRLMSYGQLGLAVLAANTLEHGLKVLVSYQALTPSLMHYSLIYDGSELIGMGADDSLASEDLKEFLQERALGSATMFLKDMLPSKAVIARIETVLDRPDGWLDCEKLLGVPVVFNAPNTRWVFKKNSGHEILPMASPLLEETYKNLCERLIAEASIDDDLVGQLYGLLVRAGHNFPLAEEAAKQLGMSERSLNRRLAAQKLSYGIILDKVRDQRARYLLDDTNLSIQQIAGILNFSETSSFSRAFKRWGGISPLQYRKKHKV